jgi:cysteine sulfinate desulfinase/cysteine desulfurase-like protein
MKEIYLDNNATTKVDEAVFEEMRPYFCELYGNPSSMHYFGGQVQKRGCRSQDRRAVECTNTSGKRRTLCPILVKACVFSNKA